MSTPEQCGNGGGDDRFFGLRVASIFIILAGSTFGATFPVVTARYPYFAVPKAVYNFAKYFGSGVIIATAFIHLLAPALDALGSPCLAPAWRDYPYALALSMLSIFFIFIIELVAFRYGTAKLKSLGIGYGDGHAWHGASVSGVVDKEKNTERDKGPSVEQTKAEADFDDSAVAQILGIAILEFGVVLHSVLIGLTLAVDPNFKILFVVIVFHQMFEGLGIGSRLAYMKLPAKYGWVPFAGSILYGITTPIGIAVGLGVRSTYNPASTKASIVSGILDALSSGILLYTGLVELLAHEFLFNKEMLYGSTWNLVYAITCMLLGTGLMALLGRWA